MDEQENKVAHTDGKLTPGKMLKDARGARSMSQADVAEKMYISVQVVKDIENDDYSHISAPIYLKGYLRAYARIVRVPEHVVLERLDELGIPQQPTIQERFATAAASVTNLNLSMPVYRNTRRKIHWLRWTTYAVVVLLLVLVIMWWQGQRDDTNSLTLPNQTMSQSNGQQLLINDQVASTSATSGSNQAAKSASAKNAATGVVASHHQTRASHHARNANSASHKSTQQKSISPNYTLEPAQN